MHQVERAGLELTGEQVILDELDVVEALGAKK